MQPLCIATDSKYEEREKWLTNKLWLPPPAEGGWNKVNGPKIGTRKQILDEHRLSEGLYFVLIK